MTNLETILWGSRRLFHFCWAFYFFYLYRTLKSLETIIEKESRPFQWIKLFGQFFSLYRAWQVSKSYLLGFTRSFNSFSARYEFILIGRKRSLETNFSKKGYRSSEERILASFLSYYRVWKIPWNSFMSAMRYIGGYCASYEIISVTPKRSLKTQVSEKRLIFHWEIRIASFLSYYPVLKNLREQHITVYNFL